MMKLLIQSQIRVIVRRAELHGKRHVYVLEHVEMATPLARSDDGKISAGMAQGTGPQLAPNASMYTKRKATLVHPAVVCCGQLPEYIPTRAVMMM